MKNKETKENQENQENIENSKNNAEEPLESNIEDNEKSEPTKILDVGTNTTSVVAEVEEQALALT